MTRFIEISAGIIGCGLLFWLWGSLNQLDTTAMIFLVIFFPYIYGLIFVAITSMFGHIHKFFDVHLRKLNFFKEDSENKKNISGHIFIYFLGAFLLLIDWLFKLLLFAN